MSVPGISLVTVLLASVVPAIGTAQTRTAQARGVTTRSARAGAPANRFEAGRLTGTIVRPAPPVDRHRDPVRIREPGYFPGYYARGFFPGLTRTNLAGYERTLARRYAAAAAMSPYDEWPGPASGRVDYAESMAPVPEPVERPEAKAHLDWKPGGIFLAGEEPAGILGAPAAAPAPPVPGVFEALVPAGPVPGARLTDLTPVIGWTEVRCLESAQEKQGPRRVPRVLGWLYRWARGFDIEKSNTTPPLLYLRSPLLSGFREPAGCGHEDAGAQERKANTCFAVTASNGFDHVVTYLVALPQLGSDTARELTAALRQRLDEGEAVALKTIGGGVVELTPDRAVSLDVRACEVRTD